MEPLGSGLCGTAASCPMTELRTAAAGRDLTARFLRKNVLHGREKDDTFIDNISIPYLLDKCDYPEVFLLTTPTDPQLYAEAKRLHETFAAKGVRHEYREYTSDERTLGHVFNVTDPEWPESITANREMLAWFQNRRALR